MLHRRRSALRILVACTAVAIVAAPYRLTISGVAPEQAVAKDNGKGGGNGGGGNSGKGDSGNAGNGKGNGNNPGDSGDSGNSEGASKGSSPGEGSSAGKGSSPGKGPSADKSDAAGSNSAKSKSDKGKTTSSRTEATPATNDSTSLGAPNKVQSVNPRTGDKVRTDGLDIEVVHPDGMKEELKRGQYQMRDAQGRTIVKRPAREADRARLRGMIS